MLAKQKNLIDPINNDIETTHETYNKAITFLVKRISENRDVEFVVATHNNDSILHAIKEMEDNSIIPENNSIKFAQLMGMKDGLGFALGSLGYSIYKV